MRITRFDRLFDVYTYTTSLSVDGLETKTYTKSIADLAGDLQPIGGNYNPAYYGLNTVAANAKRFFIDRDVSIDFGQIVRDKIDGETYIVKGLRPWYSHQELILEPHEVTLP